MRLTLFLLLSLLILPACESSQKASNVDLTLTDGTSVFGELVTVDTDWLVLDYLELANPGQLMLVDYSLIDTLRLLGRTSSGNRGGVALLGGLAGVAAGIFISAGWSFDSSALASHGSRRILLGGVAGALSGAALGFWAGGLLKDSDQVFPQPTPEDYNYLSQFARYPDTIPANIRAAIDSSAIWEEH